MKRVLVVAVAAVFAVGVSAGEKKKAKPKPAVASPANLGALLGAAVGAPAEPKEEPTGSLFVKWPKEFKGPSFVLVGLHCDSKLIRSRELKPPTEHAVDPGLTYDPDDEARWRHLPCGVYDVTFEAKGFARCVKRVCVCAQDRENLVVHVELDKEKAIHLGGELGFAPAR